MICKLRVRREKGLCPRPGSVHREGRGHVGEAATVIVLHAEILPGHVIA